MCRPVVSNGRGSKAPTPWSRHRKRRLAIGASLPATEEPALERAEQLLPGEGLDVLRPPVVLRDASVVVEDSVRLLEDVLELVPLEDVIVASRLVARPILRVHRAPDGPSPALHALDPDDDALLTPRLVEAVELTFCKARRGRLLAHVARIQSPR